MINVNFKKLVKEAQLPEYQSEQASGMDLRSVESTTLYGESIQLVGTGLALEMNDMVGVEFGEYKVHLYNIEAQIRARSSMAVKGILIANGIGTIDADYRGEIKVALYNTNANPFEIVKGDRIAQLVFTPVLKVTATEVTELGQTERGEGGFGSTNDKENK